MLTAELRPLPWTIRPQAAATVVWSGLVASAQAAGGWLQQANCALQGHVLVRHYEPHRMSLECIRCRHRTPGWEIGA